MTSVVYEEKWCRNSIDDLFPMENGFRWDFTKSFCQPTLSGTKEMENERKENYVPFYGPEDYDVFFDNIQKIEYAEFISWDEIFARENELRPDLKLRINQIKHLYPKDSPLRIKYGPRFNPFTLTLTGLFTFRTFDAFNTCYKTSYSTENVAVWNKETVINNQYFERLLIDNVEYDYQFFSNEIRSTHEK